MIWTKHDDNVNNEIEKETHPTPATYTVHTEQIKTTKKKTPQHQQTNI